MKRKDKINTKTDNPFSPPRVSDSVVEQEDPAKGNVQAVAVVMFSHVIFLGLIVTKYIFFGDWNVVVDFVSTALEYGLFSFPVQVLFFGLSISACHFVTGKKRMRFWILVSASWWLIWLLLILACMPIVFTSFF